jgi:hypothetical protein
MVDEVALSTVFHHQGTLMMQALSASETSVNFYETTRRNIPEDSHLRTRCRENLKSHLTLSRFFSKLLDFPPC